MWELAKHAKVGLAIDATLFGENRNHNYISKMKSHLANMDEFPLELADRINPCGRGTQMIQIAPEEVRLFEHHVNGELREWLP